jgi:hypothetical protein
VQAAVNEVVDESLPYSQGATCLRKVLMLNERPSERLRLQQGGERASRFSVPADAWSKVFGAYDIALDSGSLLKDIQEADAGCYWRRIVG